ncbi:MAG: DUF1638 domain-containing protein [Opitutus sp.]|nr:DUF1638 domain-containing protein [Opitutus sp.]
MSAQAPIPRIALIACRVLEAEIAALTHGATHIVRRENFEMGLHDQPTALRTRLAGAIEHAETDPAVEAVVLVYGLCGLALVELAPRRCPLVVPRAHDCITLFLGSKERYASCLRADPGLYWYSPGWNRDKRVPGPDREAQLRAAYTEKFGAEEAEALLEMERANFALHTGAGYTDLGLPGDEQQRDYAARCARSLGWSLTPHPGDPSLLRDLLHGLWDDARFLVVPPGRRIALSADDAVMKTVPATPPP